jgi:predicted AAA+ superfamily ATPase
MIQRPFLVSAIQTALDRIRIVALLGARQCGKTTLSRQFVPPDSLYYFDLEDP